MAAVVIETEEVGAEEVGAEEVGAEEVGAEEVGAEEVETEEVETVSVVVAKNIFDYLMTFYFVFLSFFQNINHELTTSTVIEY